jgi:hypothetical protein
MEDVGIFYIGTFSPFHGLFLYVFYGHVRGNLVFWYFVPRKIWQPCFLRKVFFSVASNGLLPIGVGTISPSVKIRISALQVDLAENNWSQSYDHKLLRQKNSQHNQLPSAFQKLFFFYLKNALTY